MNEAILSDAGLKTLVSLALEEDGAFDDITSLILVPEKRRASGRLQAKSDGVVAGLLLLDPRSPLREAFPGLACELLAADGHRVRAGDILATLAGPARELLAIERTILNFVQRLSGIATETARYVAETAGTETRIQETRKTCPGLRRLDKYAVRMGGGLNHRMGLHDQVLIKENHLAACSGAADRAAAVGEAVRQARAAAPAGTVIEIEVESLDEFAAALKAAPDIVMLDEFGDEDISRAVLARNVKGRAPLIEVSGGVRLERVAALAALGVDRISVGALTHSVRALDVSLKIATGGGAA